MRPAMVRRPIGPILAAGALALATLGCGAASAPTATPGGTGPQASMTAPPSNATTQSTGTSSAASAQPFLLIGGTAIGQLTPEQGVGAFPRFEWTAVAGAARYMLFVFDADGVMFWGWEGTATSVYLGGLAQQPTPGSMGPVLDGPMSWAVIAYDAKGNLIASSVKRPIAP